MVFFVNDEFESSTVSLTPLAHAQINSKRKKEVVMKLNRYMQIKPPIKYYAIDNAV